MTISSVIRSYGERPYLSSLLLGVLVTLVSEFVVDLGKSLVGTETYGNDLRTNPVRSVYVYKIFTMSLLIVSPLGHADELPYKIIYVRTVS